MTVTAERFAFAAFRRVVGELRKTDKGFNKNSAQYKYLIDQMRGHHVTQRIYSKAPREAEHVADLYASYLSSTRKLTELQLHYRGGERTVEESAKLVGLSLPQKK